MTAGDVARVTGGMLAGSAAVPVTRGRADSRLCRPGDLFVAIKGEHTDGNLYVQAAWEAGADAVLASVEAYGRLRDKVPAEKALVGVENPLEALQALAAHVRGSRPDVRVAGITGSSGKTTTREILAAILRQEMGDEVLVSEGNYNSDIGLPLTLLELRPSHRAAVLEMGMNRPGEMALLASIARPDVAVITNVGRAHAGMLGPSGSVAGEKRAILENAGPDTVAVVGRDEPWTGFLLEGFPGKVRYFGTAGDVGALGDSGTAGATGPVGDSDTAGSVGPAGDAKEAGNAGSPGGAGNPGQAGEGCWGTVESLGARGWQVEIFRQQVRFPLPGRHNLLNAMAAVEAARVMGASEESIARALAGVRAVPGRSEIAEGSLTLVRDYYNASPESLEAAFELFSSLQAEGRRVLVLGELLELGAETAPALLEAGRAVARMNPDAVFLLGEGTRPLLEAARESGYAGNGEVFRCIESLEEALRSFLLPGDLVLLKGSRKSALERLNPVLKEVGAR